MEPLLYGVGVMLIFLFLGTHIYAAMGFGTLVGLYFGDIPFSLFIERAYSNFESFPLLAVPFFLFLGEIMGKGSMAGGILKLSYACCGHLRGSMVWITVVSNLLFGALCGSPVAAVAALGSIMMPAMEKEGYSKAFAAVMTGGSCVLSSMIPPSVPLILFGSISNTRLLRGKSVITC